MLREIRFHAMNNIFGHMKGTNLGGCAKEYETTSLWQVHNHFTITCNINEKNLLIQSIKASEMLVAPRMQASWLRPSRPSGAQAGTSALDLVCYSVPWTWSAIVCLGLGLLLMQATWLRPSRPSGAQAGRSAIDASHLTSSFAPFGRSGR